jgi:hypothetical protein
MSSKTAARPLRFSHAEIHRIPFCYQFERRFCQIKMESPEKELAVDLAETAIDTVLDEGVLRDIPIVGTLLNLARLTKSIPDRIFSAKVRAFLLRLERATDLKKDQFVADLAVDQAKRAKVSEVLVLALDQLDDLGKADYISYTFMAYVEGAIEFNIFRRCLHSILDAFTTDLDDFVDFMLTKAKHPLYLPMELRTLTSGAFARDSGATRGGQGDVPYATELGCKFSEIVGAYRQRCT